MSRTRALTVAAAAAAGMVLFAACGGSADTADTTSAASATSAMTTSEAMTSEAMTSETMTSETMTSEGRGTGTLVGPGCAAYAEQVPDGAGSVDGMAKDPVATAASNNPLLTTLTAAVSGQLNPDVNLVSTLNGAEFTVFAPVDDAFAKLDAATVETLRTDAALLTGILTYHVVPGQVGPDAIVDTHTTVQGAGVEVAGEGDNLTVNGNAAVICGGVQTANATVYLIDTVLLPPSS